MLSFIKDPYSKTIFVKEDNVIIDEIFYSSIDDLFEQLKDEYFFELTSYITEGS